METKFLWELKENEKKKTSLMFKKKKSKQAFSVRLDSRPQYKLKCFESLSLSWSVFTTGTFCSADCIRIRLSFAVHLTVGVGWGLAVHCSTHYVGSSEKNPTE